MNSTEARRPVSAGGAARSYHDHKPDPARGRIDRHLGRPADRTAAKEQHRARLPAAALQRSPFGGRRRDPYLLRNARRDIGAHRPRERPIGSAETLGWAPTCSAHPSAGDRSAPPQRPPNDLHPSLSRLSSYLSPRDPCLLGAAGEARCAMALTPTGRAARGAHRPPPRRRARLAGHFAAPARISDRVERATRHSYAVT